MHPAGKFQRFLAFLIVSVTKYNKKRIKMRLGGMSPLVYRRNLGLVA